MTHNPVDDILLQVFPLPHGPTLGPLTEETYRLAEIFRASRIEIEEAARNAPPGYLSEYWLNAFRSHGRQSQADAGERDANGRSPGGVGGG